MDSRRINRIHVPALDVTFRDGITVATLDVWREDRLENNGQTYLVLDFGAEERVEFLQADLDADKQEWRPTGRYLVEVQQINAETGAGVANASFKEIAGEESAVVTWHGWTLIPCSPRRPPAAAQTVEDERPTECLMCGQTAVYWETDGTGRCQGHVGEAPEAPEDSGLVADGECSVCGESLCSECADSAGRCGTCTEEDERDG